MVVALSISNAQHKKLMSGKGIQIPHHQLISGQGEHQIELDDKKLERKIHKNVAMGKGVRIHGGSFGSFISSIGHAFKPVASIAQKAAPVLQSIGTTAAKVALPVAGKYLGAAAGDLVGAPGVGAELGKQLGQEGANAIPKGSGFKFKKGSAEAKAHMAALRAKRGSKGKGFLKSLGSVAKSVAQKALPIATDLAVKEGTKMATNYLTGSSGTGLTKGRHQKLVNFPTMKQGKIRVRNPRIKPLNRILRNGVDQVHSYGGSFSAPGYA